MSNYKVMERYNLSAVEERVTDLLMEGLSNAEIAGELCKTESWVKTHVSSVFDKVGVSSRSRLMAKLWQEGWGFRVPVVGGNFLPRGRA